MYALACVFLSSCWYMQCYIEQSEDTDYTSIADTVPHAIFLCT